MSLETEKPADALAMALQKGREGQEAAVENAKREKRFAGTGVEIIRRDKEAKAKAEAEANQLAAAVQATVAEQEAIALKVQHPITTAPVPEDSPRSSLKETDPLIGEP